MGIQGDLTPAKFKSELSELSPLKFLVEANLVNYKKIVSTNIASMILRKYGQSVLQSLCLIYQLFGGFFLFHYMQFIFIETVLSKIKPMQKSI